MEAAELLYNAGITNDARARILHNTFGIQPVPTRRLNLFATTRCQGIVTTNFDRALDIALTATKTDLIRFNESDSDLANARVASSGFLLRLHGRIEVPESIIFSKSHYRHLHERDSYVAYFRDLFYNRNLVFFGFSFHDPVINELIDHMSKAARSVFKRRAFALFPSAPPADTSSRLLAANIVPVVYPPLENHAAAWSMFASYRDGPPAPTSEAFATQKIQSILALAYARAKSHTFSADRTRVLSATLIPMISELGSGSLVKLESFLTLAENTLALPVAFGRAALEDALKLLAHDGLVVLEGDQLLVGDIPTSTDLEADSEQLLRGIASRAAVRFATELSPAQKPVVRSTLLRALTIDGLHLAYALIRGNPIETQRVSAILDEALNTAELAGPANAGVREAMKNLITHPDREEERILGNLSAVVFTVSVLLMDPVLTERADSPFEAGAYVDASVLLPWLSEGHPLQDPYDAVFKAFGPRQIRILEGYLNEVINHRRLAVEAYDSGGFKDKERLRRYGSFFELHNINTFIGGYLGVLQAGFDGSFSDYLAQFAPYDSESSAAVYLESRGIIVEKRRRLGHSTRFGELKAALRDRYKRREDIVISHDAEQLDVLCAYENRSTRPLFITADRTLIIAVSETSARDVTRDILLPRQIGYLAQLTARGREGTERFSRLLLSSSGKIATQIRKYYTDRVLKEYEYALLSELPKVVEALMEEMRKEKLDEEIGIVRGESESKRIKVFEFVDRFEPRFYEYLLEAKRKAGLR